MTDRKITAYDILKTFDNSIFNSQAVIEVSEFCPIHSGRRIDAFGWRPGKSWGYEIKVSRGDFLQDKKWKDYLQFCNYFYFLAPKGIIKPDELPKEIGLIEFYWHDNWSGKPYLNHQIVKRVRKLPDITAENYVRVLEGLAFKMAYSKNILKASL